MRYLLTLFLFLLFNNAFASNIGAETGLEIPRFVSIKSDETNLRIGPSKNYPIKIKYIVEKLPVMIVDEYDDWRKIIDFKNNSGWIHKNLITGERYGIIINEDKIGIDIYNSISGKIIGKIFSNNIVFLKKCKIDWCLIEINNKTGWIKKKYIWGVKKNELLNIGFFQIFVDTYWKIFNFFNT